MNNENRLPQHPLALSRGIYPSASGQRYVRVPVKPSALRRQGINPRAESQSSYLPMNNEQ